jgi:hypothetical protein
MRLLAFVSVTFFQNTGFFCLSSTIFLPTPMLVLIPFPISKFEYDFPFDAYVKHRLFFLPSFIFSPTPMLAVDAIFYFGIRAAISRPTPIACKIVFGSAIPAR